MNKISVAEYISENETDQLASPIIFEKKREFVFISFFLSLSFDLRLQKKTLCQSQVHAESS